MPKGIEEAWHTPAKKDKLAERRRIFLRNMPGIEARHRPNQSTVYMAYFSVRSLIRPNCVGNPFPLMQNIATSGNWSSYGERIFS
jgi:hypothetical protein